MDAQTLLFLSGAAFTIQFIVSARDQWPKWQKEGKGMQVWLHLLSLIVAWALAYGGWEQGQARERTAMAVQRRDAEQIRVRNRDLDVKNQDLEARLIAQGNQLRLLADCIPDPKHRQQAKAGHPELQRGVSEELPVSEKANAVVKRAPRDEHF
jgi:hypothetical protein